MHFLIAPRIPPGLAREGRPGRPPDGPKPPASSPETTKIVPPSVVGGIWDPSWGGPGGGEGPSGALWVGLGASWTPPGGLLEASWGLLAPLGGPPGSLLGASWGLLEAF